MSECLQYFLSTEAFEKSSHPKILRLVEDGLFSGTEIRAVLDSLRGCRPTNRRQKVPQLPDISRLSKVPAEVHFGVVCDFGVEILRYYTASNSLPNIQVALSTAARKFRVLNKTADAGSTDESENEYTFRNRLRSRVEPYAFQADQGVERLKFLR